MCINYTEHQLQESHNHKKADIERSNNCGCFYCMRIFSHNNIIQYTSCQFPICPYCGIDSVVGDCIGLSITVEFLMALNKYWFNI